MRVTIFAASGGVGRKALELALARGHDVTAVVRDPARLNTAAAGARVVAADLAAPDSAGLASAVATADAVLSCLGPREPADAGIASRGTRAIVAAMDAANVQRIVALSAAPVATVPSPDRPQPPKHDPGDGFLMRNVLSPLIQRAFREPYADLAVMEDVLRASDLAWTVLRPPRLTDGPLTGTYRTAHGQNVRRGLRVSRNDVAHCLLALLERPDTAGRTIGIAT